MEYEADSRCLPLHDSIVLFAFVCKRERASYFRMHVVKDIVSFCLTIGIHADDVDALKSVPTRHFDKHWLENRYVDEYSTGRPTEIRVCEYSSPIDADGVTTIPSSALCG